MKAKIIVGMPLFFYGTMFWMIKLISYIRNTTPNTKGIIYGYDLRLFDLNIYPIIPSICLVVGFYLFYSAGKNSPSQSGH
jgi:hypothetical protein